MIIGFYDEYIEFARKLLFFQRKSNSSKGNILLNIIHEK